MKVSFLSNCAISALLLAPAFMGIATTAQPAGCSSDFDNGVSAGDTISSTYGRIVVVGDSLLDGNGSTEGMVEETLSVVLDGTVVVNNAIGGASLYDIVEDQPSCGCYVDCKWSVVNGGINGMYDLPVAETINTMKDFVEGELFTGKEGVIIQGYAPDCDIYASGSTFNAIMDGYRDIAASTAKVWFVDPRTGLPGHPLLGQPCDDTTNIYRIEEDNSHPTPFSGELMAVEIANIIRENSNGNGDDVGESEDGEEDEEEEEEDEESEDEEEDEESEDEDEDEESEDEDEDEESEDEDEDEGSEDEDEESEDEGSEDEEDSEDGSEDEDEESEDEGSEDEDEDEEDSEDGSEDEDEESEDEDEDEGSEDEDESEDEGNCVDQPLAFKNKAKWDCGWVGLKPKIRCPKVWEGMELSEYCPVTCGVECGEEPVEDDDDEEEEDDEVGCIDDAEFRFKNKPFKDCSWVAKNPSKLCKKKWQGSTISAYCSVTCGSCVRRYLRSRF